MIDSWQTGPGSVPKLAPYSRPHVYSQCTFTALAPRA